MRILLEDTVAVCVDIQEKFTEIIYEFDKILKNSQILIDGLNVLEVPVIVTEQYPKGLGYTIPAIKKHFKEYNPIEKLAFSSGAVLIKKVSELYSQPIESVILKK